MSGLAWVILITLLWTMIFQRWRVSIGLSVIGIWLILSVSLRFFSLTAFSILGIIWLIILSLIVFKKFRYRIITMPFLHWFQRENPPLSSVEQQVIDAGGVWWGDQIFGGEPNWQEFLSKNDSEMTAPEQAFLDNQVTTLCDLLDEWKISYQDYDLSAQAWAYIKTHQFWALEMDPKYGGHGFSPLAHAAIIGKIATTSMSAAITVMVPNSLGPAEFLKYYGTDQQKNYYLPRLASGEEVPCFALTGIESGSDASSITDTGVVSYGDFVGEKVLGICLNWDKRYITLAPIATLIGLAFRLYDPEHLLGPIEDVGITLALIPADLPGIEKGSRHFPLNMGFMNGPIRGENVFIPLDKIIGGQSYSGQGWKMMMECLVVGRGISLPSVSTAMIQSCWRLSSAYAVVRYQFNRPIIKFEGIQQALARIGGIAYLAEATRLCTVESIQTGARPGVASAIAKYHLTELARQIVADSMDIHAGHSIQLGPKNYLGMLHNAVPINITVEGANILTRGLIIYGQGVMRCHPYLRNELTAAMSMNVDLFDKIFFQHVAFILSHISRLIIYGLTGGHWISKNIPKFEKKYFRQLTRMSNAFAVLTDITLLFLGKKLKFKESLSARMGDILSHIYMAAAVLRFFHRNDNAKEQNFVDWSVIYCFGKIQSALMDFLANFPVRWLAKLLRWLIFPWGLSYLGSTDQVGAQIAGSLQDDDELRQRLTQHCYYSPNSAARKMEQAMHGLQSVAALLKKLQGLSKENALPSRNESYLNAQIRRAFQQKLIDEDEHAQLQMVADLCWQAIQVSEFTSLKEKE